jgi:hypothetical protein
LAIVWRRRKMPWKGLVVNSRRRRATVYALHQEQGMGRVSVYGCFVGAKANEVKKERGEDPNQRVKRT